MKDKTIKTYQLKNGEIRYGFRVYTGINPKTGKASQTTRRGFMTYNEALKEKQYIHSLVRQHQYFSQNNLSFLDVYNEWFNLKTLSVKSTTLLTYQAHLSSFKELHAIPIDKISSHLILNTIKNITKQCHSQSSLDAKWSFLTMIFNYAFNCHYIDINPLTTMPHPKLHQINTSPKKYLTEKELTQFLKVVKKENIKYYYLCYLAAMTGMRIGELMALKWNNIDFKHHSISILQNDILNLQHQPILSTPKTKNSIRTIAIDKKTIKLLKEWQVQNTSEFLFPNRNGTLANTDIPKTWINRFCHHHPELPFISFHTFRHTHASMLFHHHVPPKIIQHRLGHSSIKITMDIYVHLTDNEQQDSIQQFFEDLHLQ